MNQNLLSDWQVKLARQPNDAGTIVELTNSDLTTEMFFTKLKQ